ncbi:N-acetyl-gamma-glutamyl-phosphate reductase [Erysipelotrichaceae bacterium RD49]|nr:N-acetyl-gamma-glutamyl-phosphate reductase [Erysipelotrichaceae bacterium RD49]
MKKIYIDGQAGTTGLQIHERLKNRPDLQLLEIDPALRKDPQARKALMSEADLVFLCLPDAAAKEAVELMQDLDTRIIDASTAHRTNPDWTYGFPELDANHKEAIKTAKCVANPGCHASGFIALVYPLVKAGLLDPNTKLSAFSLTGYSGGGRKMIEDYERNKTEAMASPKVYGLNLNHKHLPEMKAVCQLNKTPLFTPIVDDFAQGMLVSVFIDPDDLTSKGANLDLERLTSFFQDWYANTNLQVHAGEPSLYSNPLAGTDLMELFINGNENGYVLSARFDNLGKGASGAAVQNMNLMLGLDENEGLQL